MVSILNDASGETLESFSVGLTGVSGDGALGLVTNATVNIVDDDSLPSLSINDVSLFEGNSGVVFAIFTVSLSTSSSETISVAYTTLDGTGVAGSAPIGGNDYIPDANVLVFAPGETAKPITITINSDTVPEGDETFYLNLFNATNAAIAKFLGTGTILNDDPPPAVSVNDISATEGNSGSKSFTFTLTLSRVSSLTAQVDLGTAPGTASAGTDFVATNGTVQFAAGSTTATVSVLVIGDLFNEPDETFYLILSNAVNATIADGQGQATILNDDPLPSALSINDISVSEGNSGSTFAAFTVTLSPTSALPVSVSFATSNGTALSGTDYTAISGALAFGPGEGFKPITVTIKGDTNPEPNETFFINLSSPSNATLAKAQGVCTILNDDEPSLGIQTMPPGINLFWPTTYEGFQLYCTTNLGSSTAWALATGPVTPSNGINRVLASPGGPFKFYRLQTP